MPLSWPEKRQIMGTRVQRLDGPVKATGHAKYSFDINRPGMLHGMILRCPYAHAKVKSIDTTAAEKMPGVKAVFRIVKEGDELFYSGDEVLALAADTEEHARDALRAVKVEYDPLDFQVLEEDALKKDLKTVPPVGPQKDRANVRPPIEGKTDKFDDGLKGAEVVVEGDYGVSTICHQCLESHGLVAEWGQDGSLTVWCSTQAVTGTAQALSRYFSSQKPPVDLPLSKVRCVTHYMGGGFGSKFGPDVQGQVAAELALKAKAPVKLMLDRAEEVTTAGHRGSSTDMGDLSHVLPAIHPYAGGASGEGHGADYRIADPERAIVNPAKAMALTVVDLLADGAAAARRVLAAARPPLTRAGYLQFLRDLFQTWEYHEPA